MRIPSMMTRLQCDRCKAIEDISSDLEDGANIRLYTITISSRYGIYKDWQQDYCARCVGDLHDAIESVRNKTPDVTTLVKEDSK